MADMRALEMHTEPEAHRLTADEIQTRTLTPDPSRAGGFGGARRPAGPTPAPTTALSAVELRNQINKFLSDEGAAAALTPGVNGDGGTVFATWGGSQNPSAPVPPPMALLPLNTTTASRACCSMASRRRSRSTSKLKLTRTIR
jgi:carboxypeptidase Q